MLVGSSCGEEEPERAQFDFSWGFSAGHVQTSCSELGASEVQVFLTDTLGVRLELRGLCDAGRIITPPLDLDDYTFVANLLDEAEATLATANGAASLTMDQTTVAIDDVIFEVVPPRTGRFSATWELYAGDPEQFIQCPPEVASVVLDGTETEDGTNLQDVFPCDVEVAETALYRAGQYVFHVDFLDDAGALLARSDEIVRDLTGDEAENPRLDFALLYDSAFYDVSWDITENLLACADVGAASVSITMVPADGPTIVDLYDCNDLGAFAKVPVDRYQISFELLDAGDAVLDAQGPVEFSAEVGNVASQFLVVFEP